MESFKSFLVESPTMDALEKELRKYGYTKFKRKTQTVLLVYVPKSERDMTIQDIAKKLGGEVDKSPKVLRGISSGGAVNLQRSSKFSGLFVGVKPDLSKGLKTDEQETLAGIFIATKLANPNTQYTFEDLQRHGDRATVSKYKIKDLHMKAGKGWLQSSAVIADTIAPYLRGKYEVHQRSGSKFEKNISKHALALLKEANRKMSIDKWNPADIWLVKSNYANHDFSQYGSIVELNKFLLDKFKSKEIIGVSLKQVGKTAKVQVFNEKALPALEFESWDVGKTGFVGALNGTIYFSGQSMIIRNFGRPEGVSGEINGKLAQGGKVSTGALRDIWARHDRRFNMTDYKKISSEYEKDPEKVLATLYQHMKDLDKVTFSKYPTVESFADAIQSKSNELNYVISKTQVSELIKSLDKMDQKQKNELVGELVSYAMSSTDVSSVFYKVS